MSRLPKQGEPNWGPVLSHYLKQSHDSTGRLLAGSINPHTGGPNPNLAGNARAGLVQLSGDLGASATAPAVTGIQGNPVSSAEPKHGQTLVWNAETSLWEPGTPDNAAFAQAMKINSLRI